MSPNGALRGHLVPHALHAQARRAKTRAESQRSRRVTWDEVAQEALDALSRDPRQIRRRLEELAELRSADTGGPRLVQATIRRDQDAAFRELRLDLIESLKTEVTFEQLWSIALATWVSAQR
jgi:hypothetical protein